MYIRQISRKRKDGTRIRYLQLAQKVRDPDTGIPRDKVLYHFGPEHEIAKEQLRRLVKSLSRFLEPEVRTLVQAELEGIGSYLSVQESLPYGGSWLLDRLWQDIGIRDTLVDFLRNRSFTQDIERLLFALVAGRALSPDSKLFLEKWVGKLVHIDSLDGVQVHALYRAMDFLIEHDQEIQRRVYFSVATLLNLEVDLLFFDTTSSYFEIDEEDEDDNQELRRYGHSKDHRSDRPQIVIGLAVTRDGIPVRCWTLPGNTADASLVSKVQEDMVGWKLNRVVWVVDRGMAGESQRLALQRGSGHFILGEKLRNSAEANREALAKRGRYQHVRDNLEVKEVKIENGSEIRRFIIIRNPEQAKRDKRQRKKCIEKLEKELLEVNRTISKRNGKHNQRVCALKTHPSYGRFIRELKSGELRVNRKKVHEEEGLDGKYLLSTSDASLSAEDVALGYKQLIQVERAFRTLKHTLDLRPMYHRLADRIKAHVLLCWLALLLVRVIEQKSGFSWPVIRQEFQRLCLVKLFSNKSHIKMCTELTPDQRKILKSLKLNPPKRVLSITRS